eukprot:48490_1
MYVAILMIYDSIAIASALSSLKKEEALAAQFAPYLHFDIDAYDYPMDADIFYKHMMQHPYSQRMLNPIFDVKSNPIYFRIIQCDANNVIIKYEFFYGYQGECNTITPQFIKNLNNKLSSIHNGDWEQIMVYIHRNNNASFHLTKVKYFAHGDHYTRDRKQIEINDLSHPSVYVSQIQHGSFPDEHTTALMPCLFWDDNRRKGPNKTLKTEHNLINLNGCEQQWCQALQKAADSNRKVLWGTDGISTNPMEHYVKMEHVCTLPTCKGGGCNDSAVSAFYPLAA